VDTQERAEQEQANLRRRTARRAAKKDKAAAAAIAAKEADKEVAKGGISDSSSSCSDSSEGSFSYHASDEAGEADRLASGETQIAAVAAASGGKHKIATTAAGTAKKQQHHSTVIAAKTSSSADAAARKAKKRAKSVSTAAAAAAAAAATDYTEAADDSDGESLSFTVAPATPYTSAMASSLSLDSNPGYLELLSVTATVASRAAVRGARSPGGCLAGHGRGAGCDGTCVAGHSAQGAGGAHQGHPLRTHPRFRPMSARRRRS